MRRLIAALALAALCAAAGCNTIAGIGKDIQRGGEVLEGAAGKGRR